LASHVTAINPIYAARLHNLQAALQARRSDPAQAARQAQALIYNDLLRQSAMVAYVDVFRLLAWLCVALIPLMFFMKPIKPRSGPSVPVH
jgi:DHA2 family multidrug resistance protein